ncbi:MAG: hypothetical protein KA369_13980 [Spirochaetes bacterium]|nr:hypothetical protein [Spirochaetota bacterium]
MAINYNNLGFVRGIAFDLMFCLYLFFLEPLLLPELKSYVDHPYTGMRPTYWIALLLIAALLCEVPGIYLKFKAIGEKMLKRGLGKPGQRIWLKWGFIIYLFHAAVFLLVIMSAFRALGLTFRGDKNLFRLALISYLAIEGCITYFIFSAKIPERPRTHALIMNILGETCLFIFGTIAFTVTWRLMPLSIMKASSGIETALSLFFASILFLMFYLPCNLGTVFDHFLTAISRRQVLYRVASLVLVVAAALYPMRRQAEAKWKTAPERSAFEEIFKVVDYQLYKQRMIDEMDAQRRAR